MRELLVLSLIAACRYGGSFECETDPECRARGYVGKCELETGYCTFNDANCPSGFRYADSAGGGVAGTCVSDAPPDASIDASTFDPATCPATYTGTLTGYSKAKYRTITPTGMNGNALPFPTAVAMCEADLPGATHAVSVDTANKAAVLLAYVGSSVSRVWIGLVQKKKATTVGGDWILFTGEIAPSSLWASAETEPDDANSSESDHAEQAGAIGTMGFYDQPATLSYPIVCECDGRSSTDEALAAVEGR